jgi:hypothetical protein
MKYPGIDRSILKSIFTKQDRILKTSGWLLWTWSQNYRPHKTHKVSCPAEQLLPPPRTLLHEVKEPRWPVWHNYQKMFPQNHLHKPSTVKYFHTYTCKISTTLSFVSHLVWDLPVELYTHPLLSSVGPGCVTPSWSPHTQEGLYNPVLQYAAPLWCKHLGWCNTVQAVSLMPCYGPIVNIFTHTSHSVAFIK